MGLGLGPRVGLGLEVGRATSEQKAMSTYDGSGPVRKAWSHSCGVVFP